MASTFDRLKHVARRVSKLERMVKHILANCCDYYINLPETDFIVDRFDRADASNLGKYWSDPAAFQLRSGQAVSFKGHTAEREEALLYINGSVYLHSDAGVERYGDYKSHRVSRVVSALVPSDDVFTEKTLAAYQALLTSADHTIEVGFTLAKQELEGSPPGTIPSDSEAYCYGSSGSVLEDYPTCYTSVASQIRPAARYSGRGEKTGITVKADFGDTTGYEWTITQSRTYSLGAYHAVDGAYTWSAPAISLSAGYDEQAAEADYVGHNIQLATFGQTEVAGTFVLNEPLSWLKMNGFRFPLPPYSERGFGDVDDLDCASWVWGDYVVSETDVQCRRAYRYYNANPTSNSCYYDDSDCAGLYAGCTQTFNPPTPLHIKHSTYVHYYGFPAHEGSPALLGENVLRMVVKGDQVTVTVNGTTVASYTQASVAEGRQVGLFAAGDAITFAQQYGLSAYPAITHFKAWADGTPEPPADESGHGIYVDGKRIWLDGYHDEDGKYDPLALDS